MSHRHPSASHPSYAMPHSFSSSSADACHHPSESCYSQGTRSTYHAHSPSRSAPRNVGSVHTAKIPPFMSGRKRGRSIEEDSMALERPMFDPRPTSHRRAVSMNMSGRPSNTASLPVEPHPLWLSSELARTGPPVVVYPLMGCLLRSPLPAPPPPSSRRPSSHRESVSPTLRMTESPSKDRIVPGSRQMSALVRRENCQGVNPGQSPERYTVYERSRTSVPELVDFTNTTPRIVSGLPKDPSRVPTNLDPRQPYPSPPKSRSDRSSAHTSSRSPQSSTTAVSRSTPLFVISPGDIPLPLPSPSRRQPVSVPNHSCSLEHHLPPNFKRRRTTSQASPPHSSSSSMSSTRANRTLASDCTSRKPDKHRASPPLRPRSPPMAKPGLFSAELPVPSYYKASIPDRDIYAFPPAVLPQEYKVTTERVVDHRYKYSLPQINQARRRTLSSSKGHANISVGSLDLTKRNQPEQESPQDVCLPSFELLLNGIQEMRMREQSGESTGMTIMDAV